MDNDTIDDIQNIKYSDYWWHYSPLTDMWQAQVHYGHLVLTANATTTAEVVKIIQQNIKDLEGR